jgi:hypothetical protein
VRKVIGILVLLFLWCTANAEEANSIDKVERLCLSAVGSAEGKSTRQVNDAIECMTYLRGLWDGFQQASGYGPKLFCPVDNIAAQDMARLFLAGSMAVPKETKSNRGSAPLLFTLILNKKYQCK